MDEGHAMFVDGDEEVVGVVGVSRLLHFEESGPEGGPLVDELQERDLGVLRTHALNILEDEFTWVYIHLNIFEDEFTFI